MRLVIPLNYTVCAGAPTRGRILSADAAHRYTVLFRSAKAGRAGYRFETDILAEGSLDYSDEVLESFDCVMASINCRFERVRKRT
jgi:hypothetical protein